MEKKNECISSLQYAIIGFISSISLFVGLGTMIILSISKQDSWITPFASIIIGIIPLLLIIYVINYRPSVNIFEKNKNIFGSILGQIINFIVVAIIFGIFVINIWSLTNYANVKYLAETPLTVISLMFIIPAIYACFKGIESIGRTSEILALFIIIIFAFIMLSLGTYIDIENIKPILPYGIKPIVNTSLLYASYSVLPFFLLTAIPKKNIDNSKKSGKHLIIGYLIGILSMTIVYSFTISVLGVDIVTIYRYPEYYVMKKIELFGTIENVENFFATHWLFNMFIFNTMALYFIKEYVNSIFTTKTDKGKIISISIIALLAVIGSDYVFTNTTVATHFMKNNYPVVIALPILIIIMISSIIIRIRKKKTT